MNDLKCSSSFCPFCVSTFTTLPQNQLTYTLLGKHLHRHTWIHTIKSSLQSSFCSCPVDEFYLPNPIKLMLVCSSVLQQLPSALFCLQERNCCSITMTTVILTSILMTFNDFSGGRNGRAGMHQWVVHQRV